MSQEIEIIRVFVASPSDVALEKEVVVKATEELNKSLGPGLGVRFETIRSETHTYPTLGSDPQAIVNRQIADDFEIFVGILWARFGSPTPRAGSGTQEEFLRAKERFERDPNSISVMFYFKEEPVSPFDIDPEQLGHVQSFRKALAKEALYGTFTSEEELGSNIRIHLSRVLLERKSMRLRTPDTKRIGPAEAAFSSDARDRPAETKLEEQEEEKAGEGASFDIAEEPSGAKVEEDEEGLIDLVERGNARLSEAGAIAQRMAAHLNELTGHITTAGGDLQAMDFSKGGDEAKRAKHIINELADKMNVFSDRIQAELSIFGDVYAGAMKALEKSTLLVSDFEGSGEVLEANLQAIRQMAEVIPQARAAMLGLQANIEKQPRITTEFNRAKRRSQKTLGDVDRQFSAAYTLTREVIKLIEAQIGAREATPSS